MTVSHVIHNPYLLCCHGPRPFNHVLTKYYLISYLRNLIYLITYLITYLLTYLLPLYRWTYFRRLVDSFKSRFQCQALTTTRQSTELRTSTRGTDTLCNRLYRYFTLTYFLTLEESSVLQPSVISTIQ